MGVAFPMGMIVPPFLLAFYLSHTFATFAGVKVRAAVRTGLVIRLFHVSMFPRVYGLFYVFIIAKTE